MHLLAATNRFWKKAFHLRRDRHLRWRFTTLSTTRELHTSGLGWLWVPKRPDPPTSLALPKAASQEFFYINLGRQRLQIDTNTHTHGGGHGDLTQVLTLG